MQVGPCLWKTMIIHTCKCGWFPIVILRVLICGFWKNLRTLCRKAICYAVHSDLSVFVLNFFYILLLKQDCRALYSKNKEGCKSSIYQSCLGSTLHPTCARWAYPIFGDLRQKLLHTSRLTLGTQHHNATIHCRHEQIHTDLVRIKVQQRRAAAVDATSKSRLAHHCPRIVAEICNHLSQRATKRSSLRCTTHVIHRSCRGYSLFSTHRPPTIDLFAMAVTNGKLNPSKPAKSWSPPKEAGIGDRVNLSQSCTQILYNVLILYYNPSIHLW